VNLVGSVRAHASLLWLATLGMLVFGAWSLRALPSGVHPEVDFPRLVVVARVADLPPEVIERTATRPLEEAIAAVPGITRLRARTIRGQTELDVQLEAGTDVWRALQLVQSQVAEIRTELPAEAVLQIERVTPTSIPIVTFNLEGRVDPRVLRETALRVVRPALSRVPGAGLVTVQGGDVREIEVVIRPEALAAAHLEPRELADQLEQSDFVSAVGRTSDAHQVLTVVAASEHVSPQAIAALPIRARDGGVLRTGDLADVFEGAEDRSLTAVAPSGDAVVVMVARSPSASAPDVARGARRVVDALARSHTLPPGVEIHTVYDQSVLVDDAITSVRDAIALGVVLSLLVLALFLRDVRAGLSAAIAVPVTLLSTFGVMRLCGQTLNLMSLGGLAVAIGLVVDDAIVIVEAIVQRLERGEGVDEAAEHGTADLLAPVVGTTLTTVIVFAPLPLIAGVVGSFFAALAVTLAAAVLLSLFFSVTLVPLTAAKLMRARSAKQVGASSLTRAYGRAVRLIVRRKYTSLAVAAGLCALAAVASSGVGVGFLPTMDEGAFVLDFFMPQGTSLEETNRIATRIDRILSGTAGIQTFTRRTGAEMGPATATEQNSGDILVRLAPAAQRRDVYAIMDEVRAKVATEVPEARTEMVQMLQDVLDDLSGRPNPLEVRILGPDPAQLDLLAHRVAERIGELPDLEDFFDGIEGAVPTLRADVDPRATQRLGITPADVREDLAVAIAGREVSQVRVDNQSVGVRVRGPDRIRFDPQAIAAMPLAVGDAVVPLWSLAHVAKQSGPSVLRRENGSPVVLLTAGVRHGADLGAVVRKVHERLAGLVLPQGYRLEVGGLYETSVQAQAELLSVLGLGLLLVLCVLLVQLGSLRLSLVVLLGAPLGLLGALVTLRLTGIPLNVSSLMGGVLLAGLVVKNGILLLERARTERASAPDFGEAVARAGERRVRPILMTTAATIAGLFPLVLGLGAGAELQRPLAVATLGGLVVSTLVTLFLMPALAAAVERS